MRTSRFGCLVLLGLLVREVLLLAMHRDYHVHVHPSILLAIISHEDGAAVSAHCAMNIGLLGGAGNVVRRIQPCPHDLVRARSRMAFIFQFETPCTHICFWDADVSVDDPVRVLQNMLAIEEDVVFTPYPKKKYPEREWPMILLNKEPRRKKHGIEIAGCGMGLTLISRRCIETMYADSKPFNDKWGGVTRTPHAMFMLRHIGEELLPEDYSFCHRWRELGGTIWANAADLADHFGGHLFEGKG